MNHHIYLSEYLFRKYQISISKYRDYYYSNDDKHVTLEIQNNDFKVKLFNDFKVNEVIEIDSEHYNYTITDITEVKAITEVTFKINFKTPLHTEEFTEDMKGYRLYGVIAPDGKFYQCNYTGHFDLIVDLKQRDLISNSPTTNSEYEYFGFVKLSGSMISDNIEFLFSYELTDYDWETKEDKVLATNFVTDSQLKTMKKYCELNNRKYICFNYSFYKVDEFFKIMKNVKTNDEFELIVFNKHVKNEEKRLAIDELNDL